jgi:RNA polymerase sigma factor (sigma-70 family)
MAHLADTSPLPPAALGLRSGQRRRLGDGRSDAALVARVRAGDDVAFEALYDAYHRRLLTFCQHMLGSREEAEDVVQHTFLAAYRCLRAGYDVVAVKPWLYTVARNRCLSVVRTRREEITLEDGGRATDGLADEVDRRAELRTLVRDVQRLPPDQRAALVLFEVGDHSHQEIASVLGVRREKVKALVFQAREALMGWRTARETPCAHVREQLATLSGGALGRGTLRRHVQQCAVCADYEAAVRRQRAALAIALPVAPAAGLRAGVLGSALGGSGVGAAVGVGGVTSAAGGLAAKILVAAALLGGAGATVHVAGGESQKRSEATAAQQRVPPPIHSARLPAVPGGPATPAALLGPATATRASAGAAPEAKAKATQARATAKAHRAGHHVTGTRAHTGKATSGKAAAPGRLKVPGAPAEGKALGAGRVQARSTKPAALKPARPSVAPKAPRVKPATGAEPKAPKAPKEPKAPTAPSAAAPTAQAAPGESAGVPPGQARTQDDSGAKQP